MHRRAFAVPGSGQAAVDGDSGGASSRHARIYAHTAFVTCLCLQRFGIHLGATGISLSVPVLFGLTGMMLIQRRGQVSVNLALLFGAFALWGVLSTWAGLLWPDPRVGISLLSFYEILALYVMFIVRPAGDFDGRVVQQTFLFYVRLCAACGIIEFLLQFVHVRVFSFGEILPRLQPILLERDFASDPVLQFGSSLRRSNGFFLLEASIFSQVLALGIVLDYLVLGSKRFLPLYVIAYLTSFSGTGLLTLVGTLMIFSLSSGRHLSRAVMIGVAGLVAAALFAVLLPDAFNAYLQRFNEIGSAGTSGNARYLGQLEELREFGGDFRALLGYGPGSTMRTAFWTAGSGNPAMQLFIDYGLTGLLLFSAFITGAVLDRRLMPLSIALLINFQFGGGNLFFQPFTLLMVALGVWAPGAATQANPSWRQMRGYRPAISKAG